MPGTQTQIHAICFRILFCMVIKERGEDRVRMIKWDIPHFSEIYLRNL